MKEAEKGAGHSPLPWGRSPDDTNMRWDADHAGTIVADIPYKGAPVSQALALIFADGCIGPEMGAANAALIVRAVNCHAELVEALEAMLTVHDDNEHEGRIRFAKGSYVDIAAKDARKALARAKGA